LPARGHFYFASTHAISIFLWLPHTITVYIPPAETIENVNVATDNFEAEQGMAGGAAITVITKSRTDNFQWFGLGA
jgi:hypothetical protein